MNAMLKLVHAKWIDPQGIRTVGGSSDEIISFWHLDRHTQRQNLYILAMQAVIINEVSS